MKFKVERDVLGEAVAWVARALPSRPVVPVLSGVLLQAGGDELTLSCFDYEVSARVRVTAELGEPGTALVPGRLLAEIVRSLPGYDVEVTSADGMVTLTCGSAEFGLVALPLDHYPELPALPAIAGVVDGGVLATAATQVVPAASRDDTLPMLTAVCMDFEGSELTLATTDRYRLAVRTVRWDPADSAISARALVPARTLADVARTMSPGHPVTIAVGQPGAEGVRAGDGLIAFEGGGRRLTARLLGGEFIKYQARFPAGFEAVAELAAAPFTEAVRRVALVADRAMPVRLAFRHDVVVIEAQSDGRARGSESVPVQFGGPEQTISFNPHWLLDGLAAAALCGQGKGADGGDPAGDGAGLIRLEFTSPAKPALITWAGAGTAAANADAGDEDGHEDARDHGELRDSNEASGGEGSRGRRGRGSTFRYLVVPQRAPVSG